MRSSTASVEIGEGRARLVHEDDLGPDRDGAGDAQPLLLTTREARAGLVEAVLDLVPQVGAAQAGLDQLVGVGLLDPLVVELDAGEDVLADGHGGEGVGLLEDHADLAADHDRVDTLAVEVLPVDDDLALDVGARDDLVHAVERTEEGRLAAARGADEGGDRPGLDGDGDVLHGEEVAVVDVEVLDVDALGHVVVPCLSRQRPVLGAKNLEMRRATMLSTMTITMRTSAAVQAASSRPPVGSLPLLA